MVVLNSTSLINLNANNLAGSNDASPLSASNNVRPTTVMPTGIVHTLKGPILTIAFLDSNGNLYDGKSSPANAVANATAASGGGGAARNKLVSNASLAIDFSYTPSAQMLSNSIADNFYGSSSSSPSAGAGANLNSSTASNTNESSSSPTATSTFVNPFANAVVPDNKFEEMKSSQQPVSKSKSTTQSDHT